MHLSIVRGCRIAAFALSAAVALGASIVLFGWALSRPALTTFGAAGVAVNPLTAICFLLLAAALLVALPTPHGRVEATLARGLALAAAALAATKLAMLLPVSLAVALIDADVRGRRPAQVLVLAAMPLTLAVLVGALFGVSEADGWGAYVPMARVTAVALLMVQLAVLAGRVEFGLTRILVSPGAGGVAARRLLPAALLVPGLAGYVRLLGQRRGLYGPEFGVVIFTVAMIAAFTLLVWWTAADVNRADAARAETEVRLLTLIRNVPLGIVVLDLDGRVLLCNDAFVELFHYSAAELAGRRVDDFIAPERDEGETASLTRRGVAGENLRRHTLRRRRDGTLIPVELYVVPLSMQGQPIGTYGVYREIAARHTGSPPREAGIA